MYGLARRHDLGGFVLNDGHGVLIEAEGRPKALDSFAVALRAEAPPLARVGTVEARAARRAGETEFAIATSAGTGLSRISRDRVTF